MNRSSSALGGMFGAIQPSEENLNTSSDHIKVADAEHDDDKEKVAELPAQKPNQTAPTPAAKRLSVFFKS